MSLAMLIAGQLYAQPTSGVPESAPPTKKRAYSAEEMKERSAALAAQVRVDEQRLQHLQATARRDKDVIKLSCVNDKYVRLKAEMNLFDSANRDLAGTLDNDGRFAAFDKVEKNADSVHKIREEAEQCAGERELTPASSENTVNPPDIIDDPTQGDAFPFGGGEVQVEPPGYASPYN